MPNYDFLLEYRLKQLNPGLAERYAGCMSLFEQMLKRFLAVFPTFTDHTLLHTLSVINITNQLLREEVQKLNAGEIYIYLMSCALHDIGMGVSDRDFDPFIDSMGLRDSVNAHPGAPRAVLIRKFHNDFSAAFVRKYWEILEIPNARYVHAIAEVGRGHRKTDLLDAAFYPVDYDLGDGSRVNLALLAALIRIADELDVASDRNPHLLYDVESLAGMSEKDIFEFSKHEAIRSVCFAADEIIISAETEKAEIQAGVIEAARTIRDTLDYCLRVIRARSEIRFDCGKIKLNLNQREVEV